MVKPTSGWEISLLGDAVPDLVEAARTGGPQALRTGQKEVAVIISAEDWAAIRRLLKGALARGADPGNAAQIGTVRVLLGNQDDGEE